MYKGVILFDYEKQNWNQLMSTQDATAAEFIGAAQQFFGGWDGFEKAIDDAVDLPADVTIEDFLNCMQCFDEDPSFTFDADAFRKSLYENVYKPMLLTEELVQSRPYITRLYTTMSADEMTVDPAFNFNSELGDVSNVHTAEQVIACDESWRVTLPQGGTVYGTEAGVWPTAIGDQPAARKISQLATKGKGIVMVDNTAKISKLLLDDAAKHDGDVTLAPDDERSAGILTGGGSDDCSVAAPGSTRPALAGVLFAIALGTLALRRRR
jgi:MYXO-CTERM domain-containing protein